MSSAAFSLRSAVLMVVPLLGLATVACADGKVQLLPTQTPSDVPLLNGDVEHDKLILTAGSDESADSAGARPQVTTVEGGSSSRRVRSAAIEGLGLNRLPWQNQQLVQGIVDDISIFRRLPAFRCEVAPQVHDYFVNNPDVAVDIWRAMGISQLKLWRTGDWSYGMDTLDGTTGTINVLYRSSESCLIVCNGMFKSPYLQNAIQARSVMHLRTSFSTDSSGRAFATHQADMFVSFPSQKIGTVARLFSPVSNVIIDRNFQEISLFIHVMWLAMGRQPGWVEQIADDLNNVSQEQRDELLKLTAQVFVKTQSAEQSRNGHPVTFDAIRPPTQNTGTIEAGNRPAPVRQAASDGPVETTTR